MWIAKALGAPIQLEVDEGLVALLVLNGWLLAWRILMRACFTASAYGVGEGLMSIPRLFIGNIIAMLAALRAVSIYLTGGPRRWEKTHHVFPRELPN